MIDRISALRLAASLLVFAAAGCTGDECTSGRAGCDGNVAENCVRVGEDEFDFHTEWARQDCGDSQCLAAPVGLPDGLVEAFCALETTPDPECPEELRGVRDAARCLEGRLIEWRYGYRTREFYCGAGTRCVDSSTLQFDPKCDSTAFCSTLETPDPSCQPGVGTACADSSTLFYCECGFRRNEHECQSPGPSCVLANLGGNLPSQGVCR